MNSPTKLQTLLEVGVNSYPDKTAIYFESRSYSYKQLLEMTQKLACGLQKSGIVSGDRVALFLPNCPEAVMAFMACYQLGAIAVPLNYRYKSEEARYVIEQTEAKLILFHSEQINIIDSMKDLFAPSNMFILSPLAEEHTYNSIEKNKVPKFFSIGSSFKYSIFFYR